MSKKIATLTFTNSINYGAVLQATALQYVLSRNNYDTSLLNYNVKHDGLKFRQPYRRFLSFIWGIARARLGYSIRKEKTEDFLRKHTNFTTIIDSSVELTYLNSKFDIFIVGSDQVWNPNIIGEDTSFFLKFVNNDKLKLSYAASFGLSQLPMFFNKIVQENLIRFNAVSVRETQAQSILEKLNIKSKVVLDPTLLLDSKEWEGFCSDKPVILEPYILCYYMPGNKPVEKQISIFAKKLKAKTGYRVISIGKKEYSKLLFNKNNRVTDGPEEFINLIKNAEFILTNSFHGVCFSINFEKQFFSFVEENYEFKDSLSSRVFSLMRALYLEERIVTPSSSAEIYINKHLINYELVRNNLSVLRKNSIDFLRNSLGR